MCSLQHSIETAFGWFTLIEEAGCIVGLRFGQSMESPAECSPLLLEAEEQLHAYFAGKLRHFALPLAPRGTAFQQRCWNVLSAIPYGKTLTYGQLAQQIGCKGAARAVGMAANRNPLPILIPCHRLIGANGTLTGYAGGIPLKERLLRLEQNAACEQHPQIPKLQNRK